MGKEIGLIDFINQVKFELFTEHSDAGYPPLFLIDSVEIEMSVGVTKGGDGKISLYVFEVGGKAEFETVQNVKVTLSPILDRETRIKMLDPKLSSAQRQQLLWASVKGTASEIKNLP